MSNIGCPVCGGDHYKSQHNQYPPNCRCKLDPATGGINRLNCPIHGTQPGGDPNRESKSQQIGTPAAKEAKPDPVPPIPWATCSDHGISWSCPVCVPNGATALSPEQRSKIANIITGHSSPLGKLNEIEAALSNEYYGLPQEFMNTMKAKSDIRTALCKYGRELDAPNDKYCANEDCPCTALSPHDIEAVDEN